MRTKSKQTVWSAITVLALVTLLPACPQEGANNLTVQTTEIPADDTPPPNSVDMKHYWPMAVGNTWRFNLFKVQDGYNWTEWEVVEDYSTADTSAFAVQHTTYRFDPVESWMLLQSTHYYIFRETAFLRVRDEGVFLYLLHNPSAWSSDSTVTLMGPRYIEQSAQLTAYFGGIINNAFRYQFTTAGPLHEALVYGHCDEEPYEPQSFVVEPDYPVFIHWREGRCGDIRTARHREYYGLGIGPIRRSSVNLASARIDGQEYSFDPSAGALVSQ
jgi:hypothetical protein